MSADNVFKRVEKKYLLTTEQYEDFRRLTADFVTEDRFSRSSISNIYFDTPDKLLIRRSIEKPVYKEKLRLRCYEPPNDGSIAFIELKKKLGSTVYKRRAATYYKEAYDYLVNHAEPPKAGQIMSEIDWFLNFYENIEPSMIICYERESIVCKYDSSLRITFDSGLRWRDGDLDLRRGTQGKLLLGYDLVLMEMKLTNAMPLWLSGALDKCSIFPASYSKYAAAYRAQMSNQAINTFDSFKEEKINV